MKILSVKTLITLILIVVLPKLLIGDFENLKKLYIRTQKTLVNIFDSCKIL